MQELKEDKNNIKNRVPVNFKLYIPKVAIAIAVANKKDLYGKSNSCHPVTVNLIFLTNPCKFSNFQILVKSFFEHSWDQILCCS